jgi:hypothetical protein
MTDTNEQLIETLDAGLESGLEPRNERREFFKAALGAAAIAGAGASAITLGGIATAQTITDTDRLNFLLNLEYLEAQFYSYAVTGAGLANADLTGTVGTQGPVTGGAQVSFTDPLVAQYAKEIAKNELANVRFLRTRLGDAKVAQPALDIGVTATSAFSKVAQAASIVSAGTGFDVYANDANFLLGAFVFADVIATAYKGIAAQITDVSGGTLEAVAGLLAVKSYHASIIRSVLYTKGATTAALRTNADAISNARDALDGTGTSKDYDQGISATGTGTAIQSNVTPLDGNGLAYSRDTGQVLNIVYFTSASVTAGAFFPAGLNGNIVTSTAQ